MFYVSYSFGRSAIRSNQTMAEETVETPEAEEVVEPTEMVPEPTPTAPTKSAKEQREEGKAPNRDAVSIFDMTGWVRK